MAGISAYVLLIRHGENSWVGSNRLAGRTPGVKLNQAGRRQAAALAEMLKRQPLVAVYSSPLERCMETAEPLSKELGIDIQVETGVQEIDYGEWQGAALKDLSVKPEWSMVQHFPSQFRFPAGESLQEAQVRAVAAIDRLAMQHANQTIAVFSHADIIRTTLAHYLGVHLDLFQRIIIGTASVSVVGFFQGKPAILAVNLQTELPLLEFKQETAQQKAAAP